MIKNKTSIKCLACNTKMSLFSCQENYKIFKCPKCNLGMTSNLKIQKSDYHRDEDYINNQKQFENIYQKRVNIVNKFSNNIGKALEIGSSTGLLLKLMQKKAKKKALSKKKKIQ